MKISEALKKYLSNSYSMLQSNIVITNLSFVIFSNTEEISILNLPISNDFKNLIEQWKYSSKSKKYLLLKNNFLKIYPNDDYKYTGQMIFPIFHDNELDGLLIFFRNKLDFVESSLKYAETTKHFVEIFTANDYIDKNDKELINNCKYIKK